LQDCTYTIMDGFELSADACRELDEAGFTIIPGPVPTQDLESNNRTPQWSKVRSFTTNFPWWSPDAGC